MFGLSLDSLLPHSGTLAGAVGPFTDGRPPLSDSDIRTALLAGPFAGFSERDGLLEEVECWRGYVRADYVLLSANELSIIEIKSDRDTLRRFDEQLRVYCAVADRVTVVVGWNLVAHALRAAPSWWNVVLAERESTSNVRFVPLRDGERNPVLSPSALVAMLPIDELRRVARRADESFGRLRGHELRETVAAHLPCDEIRAAVRVWLGSRARQRSEPAS